MKLILQGKPKKYITVYSVTPHYVGEPVEVLEDGVVVQTGEVIKDMSKDKKYQNEKKLIDGKLVKLNAGKGYYEVRLEKTT